jgi:hypothetical protein
MSTVTTTLQLLATLEDKVSPGLKGIGGSAASAEQKLGRMRATLDNQARSLSTANKDLKLARDNFDALSAKANELSDKLDKATASGNKNSAAARKLQADLDKVSTAAQRAAISVERKENAVAKASGAMQRLAQDAQRTADALNEEAREVAKSGSSMQVLATSHATAGQGMAGLVTKIGGLAAAFGGLAVVAGKAAEGFTLGAELDQSRRMLGTLFQDVERGNKVYADAIKWGQQYGYTQKEIASATASAAGIIRTSTATTEKSLEVIARLGTLNPAEGIEGAVVAIKELASGDIVSLAERFNVSKDAARAMKDEIAAGADPIMVLDAALAKMGVTAEVLSNRMEGPNGALLRNKQAMESLTLSLGTLLEAFGATYILEAFAAGLHTIAEGIVSTAEGVSTFLNQDALMSQAITDGTARMIARGATFADYAARMDSVGQSANALTQAEYEAAAAMIANGTAANDAIAAAQTLSDTQGVLTDALINVGLQSGMTAEAQAALIERTMELAGESPAAAAAVAELTDELSNTQDVDAFTAALETTTVSLENNASAAAEDASMMQLVAADAEYAAGSADMLSASIFDLTTEQYEQTAASLEAAIAAENQARFQDDLAAAVAASGDNAALAAYMSQVLASQYGMEADQVANLITLTNELNKARAGQQGSALGRAAGGQAKKITNPATGGAAGFHGRSVVRAERRERASGGGGRKSGGGGAGKAKGGKSEEVKQAEQNAKDLKKIEDQVAKAKTDYQRKVEDAARAHVEKLQAIDEEYFQKNLEATNKFNEDKFQGRVSFKNSIVEVDTDLWDQALAKEQAYWAESQAMAQAGHGEQAAALLAAGTELAQIEAQNAQELRDLRTKIREEEDAEERARLEERLARETKINADEEQLARDKVENIRTNGDQMEQERQEAIDQENQDYSEAQNTLKEDFAQTLDDIKTSYADMGAAARQTADAIIEAAQMATDAINSIPSVPGGQAVPVEARAMGGFVGRGRPYLVGEQGPELVVPRASGMVIDAARTAAIGRSATAGSPLANLSPAASGGGGGSSSVTNTAQINAPITIQGTNAGADDIQRAVAAGIKEGLRQFNHETGRSASSGIKMGGRR